MTIPPFIQKILSQVTLKRVRVNPLRDWMLIVLGVGILSGLSIVWNALLFFGVVFGVPITEQRIQSTDDLTKSLMRIEEQQTFFEEREQTLEGVIQSPSPYIDPS